MKTLTGLILILVLSIIAFSQASRTKPLAENFSAASIDGTTFDLSQLKGKVVLINFWTTRCAICASEIPKLNQLAESYKNKNVVFLGLTTDNETTVKNFLKKKSFNFNLLPNSFGILLKYADRDKDGNVIMGYPAYFLINQRGEVELKTNGFDKTEVIVSNINRLMLNNSNF